MRKKIFAPKSGNTEFIDLLRTIGILQVILFHVVHGIVRFAPQDSIPAFIDRLPFLMNVAWQAYGVDLIFLVSAFLLSWALIIEVGDTGRVDLRRFYLGRIGRILPVYYLALVIFALAQGNGWQEILATALFISFAFDVTNVIPVGWSMEVMMIYYLALPWIIMGLNRFGQPLLWLSVAIAGIAIWRYVFLVQTASDPVQLFLISIAEREATPTLDALYFAPWFRLPAFLMGTLAAYLLGFRTLGRANVSAFLSLIGIIIVLWLPVQDTSSFAYTVLPAWVLVLYWAAAPIVFARAAAIILIWGLERGKRQPWNLDGPWMAYSRTIFSVYLFHMPLLVVGAFITFGGTDMGLLGEATLLHVVCTFVVTAIAAIAIAIPLDRFVERPIRAWLKDRFG